MQNFFNYLKNSYSLEIKRLLLYKASFLLAFVTLPLWTVIQLLFVETLFQQTGSFIGYGKYEAYLLFGSYRILQGVSRLSFNKRIYELKYLIRGESNETFDQAILKPLDTQLFSSFGRVDLGGTVHLVVGIGLFTYAVIKGGIEFTAIQFVFYLYTLLLGICLWYLTMLFVRCLTFWFEELDSTDVLHREVLALGRNPSSIYKDGWSLLFNIILPLTLLGSIPTEVLLGKQSPYILLLYTVIILLLLYLVRKFWQLSIKRYSSFSS